MSRTGILSDAHIQSHCIMYRPVPLHAYSILKKDLGNEKNENVNLFNPKKLKYTSNIHPPKDFDTLAKTMAKLSGEPDFREKIERMYTAEIDELHSDVHSEDGNGNGSESSGIYSNLSNYELDLMVSDMLNTMPPLMTPNVPTTAADNSEFSNNPQTPRSELRRDYYSSSSLPPSSDSSAEFTGDEDVADYRRASDLPPFAFRDPLPGRRIPSSLQRSYAFERRPTRLSGGIQEYEEVELLRRMSSADELNTQNQNDPRTPKT